MKRLTILFALVLCLPLIARADDASRHAKAQEVVTLLHVDQMPSQIGDNILRNFSAAAEKVAGSDPSPEEKARLTALENKATQLVDAQLNPKDIEPAYTDLYAKAFTEEQLDGIIAFYKSPAGVALVANVPTLTQQAVGILRTRVLAFQPQLRQMMSDFEAASARPALSQRTPQKSTQENPAPASHSSAGGSTPK